MRKGARRSESESESESDEQGWEDSEDEVARHRHKHGDGHGRRKRRQVGTGEDESESEYSDSKEAQRSKKRATSRNQFSAAQGNQTVTPGKKRGPYQTKQKAEREARRRSIECAFERQGRQSLSMLSCFFSLLV